MSAQASMTTDHRRLSSQSISAASDAKIRHCSSDAAYFPRAVARIVSLDFDSVAMDFRKLRQICRSTPIRSPGANELYRQSFMHFNEPPLRRRPQRRSGYSDPLWASFIVHSLHIINPSARQPEYIVRVRASGQLYHYANRALRRTSYNELRSANECLLRLANLCPWSLFGFVEAAFWIGVLDQDCGHGVVQFWWLAAGEWADELHVRLAVLQHVRDPAATFLSNSADR